MEARLDSPPDLSLTLQPRLLKGTIFELLHARIIAGRYAAGEWLRQEDIASQLGVSMTPVREALDLLVSVGLAERVPYRGVRVPELTAEEIVDAYILRLVLESAAARLAALNVSQDQLDEMRSIIEQTRSLTTLDDMSAQQQLNRRLHFLLVEASGNQLLLKTYTMVSNKFPDWRLYEYMFRHPELLETSLSREYDEHMAILDALAAGDGERAACGVQAHIHNLAAELVLFLGIPGDVLNAREAQIAPPVCT